MTFSLSRNRGRRLYLEEAWFEGRATDPTVECRPVRWDDDESIAAPGWWASPPDRIEAFLARRVRRREWPEA